MRLAKKETASPCSSDTLRLLSAAEKLSKTKRQKAEENKWTNGV